MLFAFLQFHYHNDALLQFCEELLKDQLVACVPGTAFGEAGEGFIRVSYAYSIEQIKEATSRIKKFLDKLKK